MIYDQTCIGDFPKPGASGRDRWAGDRLMRRLGEALEGVELPWPGLSLSWRIGGHLYRRLGRIDAWKGFTSWPEALEWLARHEAHRPIGEIQFWGHGRWGCALIDRERLDIEALDPAHPLHDSLAAVRERMKGVEGAQWWFRTCETFGAEPGHEFARAWTSYFDCRAAGHTYVIGPWQSGLHTLRPGARPHWSVDEALIEGTPKEPERAAWSSPSEPNTISCFHGTIPAGY